MEEMVVQLTQAMMLHAVDLSGITNSQVMIVVETPTGDRFWSANGKLRNEFINTGKLIHRDWGMKEVSSDPNATDLIVETAIPPHRRRSPSPSPTPSIPKAKSIIPAPEPAPATPTSNHGDRGRSRQRSVDPPPPRAHSGGSASREDVDAVTVQGGPVDQRGIGHTRGNSAGYTVTSIPPRPAVDQPSADSPFKQPQQRVHDNMNSGAFPPSSRSGAGGYPPSDDYDVVATSQMAPSDQRPAPAVFGQHPPASRSGGYPQPDDYPLNTIATMNSDIQRPDVRPGGDFQRQPQRNNGAGGFAPSSRPSVSHSQSESFVQTSIPQRQQQQQPPVASHVARVDRFIQPENARPGAGTFDPPRGGGGGGGFPPSSRSSNNSDVNMSRVRPEPHPFQQGYNSGGGGGGGSGGVGSGYNNNTSGGPAPYDPSQPTGDVEAVQFPSAEAEKSRVTLELNQMRAAGALRFSWLEIDQVFLVVRRDKVTQSEVFSRVGSFVDLMQLRKEIAWK